LDLGDALHKMTAERKPTQVSTINSAPEIRDIIEKVNDTTSELFQYETDLSTSINELKGVRAEQDKIFAIVGHELRTPASAIKMLLNEEKHINNESHYVVEADQHATHLLNILDDMRLIAAKNALLEVRSEEANHVKVFQVLKSCIIALQPLADKHRLTIELSGSVANPLGHKGNPKAFQQIVQNLIKNAILHSKGSVINVCMEHEHLSDNKTHFTVEVRDNGKGIPVKFQARMFDAFERGDTVSDGSGLGLNVAYELAHTLEDGKLFYRDNPDGGAIFTLGFTFDKVVEKPKSPKRKYDSLEGLKILLAEDTPTLRLLGKAILERAGSTVEVAGDGEEALAMFPNFDPDLVLTDIMMPKMNGYELTAALRNRDFTKPIIGVTGATVGMEAQRLIESGANTVLAKPLTLVGLETALKSIDEDDIDSQDSA
jgi:signal transduction histidine kinase/CheY-like chemotaxis protein